MDGISLEDLKNLLPRLETSINLRVKNLEPHPDFHNIFVLKVSQNTLKARYVFENNLLFYLLREAPLGTMVIGHNGSGFVCEKLGENMAHNFLIAGSSRMGKTTFLKSAVSSVLLSSVLKNKLAIEFVFIDYKMGVEFKPYRSFSPFFIGTKNERTVALIDFIWEKRFIPRMQEFEASGTTKLEEYQRQKQTVLGAKRIIICIDEAAQFFSGLEVKYKQEKLLKHYRSLESYTDKIYAMSMLGCAIGINLWISTQHPSVEHVPSAIKTNLQSKVCFSVPTTSTSVMILNVGDAAYLSRPGHLIYSGNSNQTLQGVLLEKFQEETVLKLLPQVDLCDEFLDFLKTSKTLERRQLINEFQLEKIRRITERNENGY